MKRCKLQKKVIFDTTGNKKWFLNRAQYILPRLCFHRFHSTIKFCTQVFANIKVKMIYRAEELFQTTETKLNMKEE